MLSEGKKTQKQLSAIPIKLILKFLLVLCTPMKLLNKHTSFYWGEVKPYKISRGREISNDIYYLYSLKAERLITLESRLEYYNWLLIETNPSIIGACEQFPRLNTSSGEFYTMDAWIKRDNGEETIIEVKESKNLIEESGLTLPTKLFKYYNKIQELGLA